GAGKLTRQQIADKFEELKAQVAFTGGGNTVSVSFQTKKNKLADVLDLIALILRHPTFPEAEAEEIRTQWITGVENSRHEPSGVASNALSRYRNPYPKGDIRYAMSFDEQIETDKKLKAADAKAFHAEFYGADHGEMAVVGDFDPAAV